MLSIVDAVDLTTAVRRTCSLVGTGVIACEENRYGAEDTYFRTGVTMGRAATSGASPCPKIHSVEK
jgi:hypothetical protein